MNGWPPRSIISIDTFDRAADAGLKDAVAVRADTVRTVAEATLDDNYQCLLLS